MRIPIPKAPKMTPTSIAWAVVIALLFWFTLVGLYLVWHPLAIILVGLFLMVEIYFLGGEWWNARLDDRSN